MTDPRLEPAVQGLRDTRRRTLELVAPLSQHELDTVPEPGAWSVGEILDHLLKSDQVYRADLSELFERFDRGLPPELHRSLSEFDLGVRWVPRSLTPLLTAPFAVFNWFAPPSLRRLATRAPILPVRNAERTTPRAGRPGESLRAELEASLEETTELLGRARGELPLDRMRVTYPLIGTKTLPELLVFAADHELRHQGQIESTLRRIGLRD
jgi:uncharacterized damage-inducible protein DinB